MTLGPASALYGTDETVADLEALRKALGVSTMTLDGVSYGSFTAERYAIAHPDHVTRLVLDSVVPNHVTADESLYLVGLRAQASVLRQACAPAPACGFDPAEDLAWVVRHRSVADGVRLFDLIVSYEFYDPSYRDRQPGGLRSAGDLLGALHAARQGDSTRLSQLLAALKRGGDPVATFSSGLHAATLCQDMRFAWGDSSTPLGSRKALLDKAVRALPEASVWPYTAEVAGAQGFTQTCLDWPVVTPTSDPSGALPDVPHAAAQRRRGPVHAAGVGPCRGCASTARAARRCAGGVPLGPEPGARARRARCAGGFPAQLTASGACSWYSCGWTRPRWYRNLGGDVVRSSSAFIARCADVGVFGAMACWGGLMADRLVRRSADRWGVQGLAACSACRSGGCSAPRWGAWSACRWGVCLVRR
jgi:pimeloyl-ACP methyl ester carboxylesterase